VERERLRRADRLAPLLLRRSRSRLGALAILGAQPQGAGPQRHVVGGTPHGIGEDLDRLATPAIDPARALALVRRRAGEAVRMVLAREAAEGRLDRSWLGVGSDAEERVVVEAVEG